MVNTQNNIREEFKDFLKECGGRFERESEGGHFLITGMPRASGKTYTVLKGLLKILPEWRELLYVARTIGAGEELGTYYHTEKTIRKIEKEENLPKHYIVMTAGKNKICENLEREIENKDEQTAFIDEQVICHRCTKRKELGEGNKRQLQEEFQNVYTLTPEKISEIGDDYNVCPKAVMNFYKKEFADIVFITYARLMHNNDIVQSGYHSVVFDEARNLADVNTVYNSELINIKTEYKPSEEGFWRECWKELDEKIFPSREYIMENGGDWYYWFKRVLSEKMITREWFENLNEINKMYYAYADPDYYLKHKKLLYNEELEKWQSEYWGFQGDPDFPEYPDEYIRQLNRDTIRRRLYGVVENLDANNAEMLKEAKCLSILYKIAGSYSVEIEIIDKKPFSQKEKEYSLCLKAYKEQQIPRGEINVYIDATPYPIEFIEYWLRVEPEELNVIIMPPSAKVTIAYTNDKQTISKIIRRGKNLNNHVELLKLLMEFAQKMGKKSLLVVRSKHMANILGGKGIAQLLEYYDKNKIFKDYSIKPYIVCGGKESEGVQKDADMVILEGPQIRNPESGISKKFEIGRALKQFDSMKAHYLLQQIENCQTMIQAIFRGVDREGKRANVIVVLGNEIPPKKESFESPWGDIEEFDFAIAWGGKTYKYWLDFAGDLFPWLKGDNIHFVEINKNDTQINKVAQILELLYPDYDFELSPDENIVLRILKEKSCSEKEPCSVKEILGMLKNDFPCNLWGEGVKFDGKLRKILKKLEEKGRITHKKVRNKYVYYRL